MPCRIDATAWYTIWELHPNGRTWVRDRTYSGAYFLPHSGAHHLLKSDRHKVLPQGEDPHAQAVRSPCCIDPLGPAKVVLCNDHKRYRYAQGVWISAPYSDKSPEFFVYQAGRPTVCLGHADTLEAAKDTARANADWGASR